MRVGIGNTPLKEAEAVLYPNLEREAQVHLCSLRGVGEAVPRLRHDLMPSSSVHTLPLEIGVCNVDNELVFIASYDWVNFA